VNELPDWMRPPRPEGWFAEDLDRLPDAPRHTELIDGALVFMMSPQRVWHSEVISELRNQLRRQRPDGSVVRREITVRLDPRNRPEPDVIVARGSRGDRSRTWYDASDVDLVIEVVSVESAHRDYEVKPPKYAKARIQNYWIVDEQGGRTVVHVFELDPTTSPASYTETGFYRGKLELDVPFPIVLDLDKLTPDD
jgi:Uma2 family endonuclease